MLSNCSAQVLTLNLLNAVSSVSPVWIYPVSPAPIAGVFSFGLTMKAFYPWHWKWQNVSYPAAMFALHNLNFNCYHFPLLYLWWGWTPRNVNENQKQESFTKRKGTIIISWSFWKTDYLISLKGGAYWPTIFDNGGSSYNNVECNIRDGYINPALEISLEADLKKTQQIRCHPWASIGEGPSAPWVCLEASRIKSASL